MKKVNPWPYIKKLLLKGVSKLITSKLGLALGGFQAEVLLWLAEKTIDWVLKPIYLNLVVWVEKRKEIKKGKEQAKEVKDAQTDDDITDAFDNLN